MKLLNLLASAPATDEGRINLGVREGASSHPGPAPFADRRSHEVR